MASGSQYNLDELIWKNRGENRNIGCPRISATICDAREAAGISQQELASALEVDVARVSVWETGTEGLSRNDVEMLRVALPDADFSAVQYRPTPHHGEIAHIPTN
jgi:DNA-binding XRE family transcriptional regulator